MEGQGETQSRAALGQGPVSPSIHTTVSLSYFTNTEIPSRWEKLMVSCPQACRPRPVGLEGWCWLPLTSLLTHQKKCPETDHALIYYKTSPYVSKVGTDGFEGISPLCPPLPGKAIKLSFSTSPRTLSLRFDLALLYREAEFSASYTKAVCSSGFQEQRWS